MDAEGAYLFRHGVLRDAAYDLMPPSFRSTLHGLVADCLISIFYAKPDTVAGEIANHLAQAGPERAEEEFDFRERAARYAEQTFANEEAVGHYERIAANESLPPLKRVLALEQVFSIHDQTGDHDAALNAVARADELGDDDELQALVQGMQGRVAMRKGDLAAAEKIYLKLLARHRARGEKRREITALGNLNSVYKTQGRLDEAELDLRRALELSIELGERTDECRTLANLATLHGYREDYAAAEDYARRAIELARKIDSRMIEGATLSTLALIQRRQGRLQEAEQTYNRALVILREIGLRLHEGVALGNLGSVLESLGRHDEAMELYRQAVEIHRHTGNRRFEGIHLGALAIVTRDHGNRESARPMMEEALAIVEGAGDANMTKSFKQMLAHWDKQGD